MAYIDRESLYESISKLPSVGGCSALDRDSVEDAIMEAPSADVVEVNHGEWIVLEAEIGLYSCSLCEHKILRAECNYCPKCGAKMDGGKAE